MNLKVKEVVTNIFAKSVLKNEGKVFFSRKAENQCVFDELAYVVLNLLDTNADELFLNHIEKRHNFKKARKYCPFLWTVLHEIGHIKVDGEQYIEGDAYEEALIKVLCSIADNEKEWNEAAVLHFEMKGEWEATDWAIDFVERHPLLSYMLNYLLK